MRPGYLIVGTKRGGTTSLAAWVDQHPQVAPCRTKKGTHYFDTNYWRGAKWFFSRFEKPHEPWIITGEASPYYMYHPAGADRIADALPDVKLIAVLRDPVERAWSQYRYQVERGYESESFDRALDLEPERISGEREKLLEDPRYPGFNYRTYGYLERGHYAEQLDRIYALFPRENLLLLSSQRLLNDPPNELAKVWSFLGVEQIRLEQLPSYDELIKSKKSEPARDARSPTMRMEPFSRARLSDYYSPLNARLSQLTGVNFGW